MKIKKAIEILEGVALENEITPEIDEAICLVVEDAKKNLSKKKQETKAYRPSTWDELVSQRLVEQPDVVIRPIQPAQPEPTAPIGWTTVRNSPTYENETF